ncbi:uncharacterized protein LOC112045937 [Bicyclus anynana]|uniref:Uncharacterized protein LOC112045937 n=1 Tax=Bicyclus anynana TaxID=110368 RepID=A0A6J1MU90_BICAN|nr:uncharacterized protein LOC112045937 [Bicyclus anynana]XP_023938104.1 uncharacterized protein LOC112045937 [Bicyclus anynana]
METYPSQPTYLIGNLTTKCRVLGTYQRAHHASWNTNMLLKIENELLQSHRQRETTGIKKLYNSFFVLF